MNHQQDYVYCLAVSPNFERDYTVFAAKQSGLYVSKDRGQTWDTAYQTLELTEPLPTTSVALVTQDDRIAVFAAVEGNILRSLHGDLQWQVAELDSPFPVVTALIISPDFSQDGILLASTMQDGIFRSVNRATSWSGWNFGLYDPNINALAFSQNFPVDQTVFAGTQSGLFVSATTGRSWRDLDFPIEAAPVLSVAVDQQNTIFAGSENAGLWVSKDFGKTWNQRSSGAVEQVYAGAEGQIMALSDGEILYSMDAGQTWQSRPEFRREVPITAISAPYGVRSQDSVFLGYADGLVMAAG